MAKILKWSAGICRVLLGVVLVVVFFATPRIVFLLDRKLLEEAVARGPEAPPLDPGTDQLRIVWTWDPLWIAHETIREEYERQYPSDKVFVDTPTEVLWGFPAVLAGVAVILTLVSRACASRKVPAPRRPHDFDVL
jgi:hypothetical protein